MIDFKKRLEGKKVVKPKSPIELYETLDRKHDKGPLRPAQEAVLRDWFEHRLEQRDILVKLHTGQGKTLVGLLMLQSRLNQGHGPVVYLCPDNYLIDQTCEQARQFGIPTCHADPELPEEFLNSDRILVTSVQKLFNGLTKFGLGSKSIKLDTVLMDDAHACADLIRDQCRIRLDSADEAYHSIRNLFATELEQQGLGSYADIMNGDPNSILPVPYWAWSDKVSDIAAILSKHSDKLSIKFPWPLLRDNLQNCACIVSGGAMEIEPYSPPLHLFGSYAGAKHRIFMSATVTDDSFLVRGLRIDTDAISDPLTYTKEKWSGEKMILVPSLINDELTRAAMVEQFATPNAANSGGVVALAPGFQWTKDWERYGATVATRDTLVNALERLRSGKYGIPVVLVNRYNGIDLPDDSCRTLIFDSRPYSQNLIDSYEESCRSDSAMTLMRAVRSVEQGMGRSVRGEKDYSVIIVIGADLTRLVRDKRSRSFLSSQMAAQIEIGLAIAEMAQEEISNGTSPSLAMGGLIRQCLGRDDGWKAFYVDQMKSVVPKGANELALKTFSSEAKAEQLFVDGQPKAAMQALQSLIDGIAMSGEEKGWYLQVLARYAYAFDKVEARRLQLIAYRSNRLLLKPSGAIAVDQISVVGERRAERIVSWMRSCESFEQLSISLNDTLAKLVFGTKADRFEQGLDELAEMIGFVGERPDKEWKEGPDNLWALDQKRYVVWECKNEVDLKRSEINRKEAEQMNSSSAWFLKHYAGMACKRVIVHPASKEASAASFLHEVEVMRPKELARLLENVRAFFGSFESVDFDDISHDLLQQRLVANHLAVDDIPGRYTKKIKAYGD